MSIRNFVCALLLLTPTLSWADTGVRLRADGLDPEAVQARLDTPTRLQVIVDDGTNPLGGREVRWQVEPSHDAVLSHDKGLSSTGGDDQSPLGSESTLFTAHRPGNYLVKASTLADAACTGDDCARVAVEFHVEVPAGAVAEKEGNHVVTTALLVGAGAAALYTATRNGEGLPALRQLQIVSGNNQTVFFNTPAPAPLVVHASSEGNPSANVPISWSVSGGATLSTNSSTTDSNGDAQVFVTNIGPGPGPVTVTALRADSGAAVQFTLTVFAPALNLVSGNGQSANVNTTLPQPLVVEALNNNVPLSGLAIIWTVVSGDASIASTSGPTDAAGQASAVIDLGPTPGPVVITATRSDQPSVSVTFFVNSILVRSLAIVSGDGQTGPPNAPLPGPLTVHATDNGADASGINILWSASGGATLSSTSTFTGVNGQSSVTVTSTGPGPGPIQITATRADDPTATVTFNENLLPPNLSIVAGDGQSGLTGSAATTPLDVLLVDGAGVPVNGQTITWTVTSGSALLASGSSTTVAGHATMTFDYGGTPGPIQITASAYGGAQSVVFNETALTASGVNKTSGDNQSGNPGATLAPFVITIVPPGGATNLAGVPVTFTITSGTGTLSTTSTVTDAAGQASTTLTLGLTPGTVTVVAQVQGGPSTTFTATINGSLVATTLTIISGDGQTLAAGAPSAAMVVELTDAGTPLAGQTINWSTSNGTITVANGVTDPSGRSSATVTPNASGPIVVTASFAAVAQYTASSVSFNHNSTLGSIASLSTDQVAVAEALDSACTDLSATGTLTPEEQDLLNQCQALAAASGSDPAAVAEAIDEMLPDVAQTQTQTGQDAAEAQFSNLNVRLNNLHAGVNTPSFSGLTLTTPTGMVSLGSLANALMADEEKPKEESGFSRWGFFVSGNIGRGETDAIANAPKYDFDIKGLTAGVDYRVNDNFVLGGALGYTRQSSSLDGDQGSLKMEGWSISGYGSWYHAKDWYVDAALNLANNDYRHRRRVSYVLPGETVDQVARADSDGTDFSGSLTIGRDFHRQEWNFGLYGRAQMGRQHFVSYDEDLDANFAGAGLALHIDDRSVDNLSSILGGRATWVHSTDWGVVMPQFGLEWQKEYQGDPDTFRAFLITDPTGTPILITGEALDDSYFRLNLGVSAVWPHGRSGFIQYDRIFARDGNEQETLTIGGRFEF
jgi:uncharacterized protein with beta-barrel porin domain